VDTVTITYDPDADALYIYLTDQPRDPDGYTEVDDNGLIRDYTASGELRGVELLSVRSRGVDPSIVPPEAASLVKRLLESGGIERGEKMRFDED
jgi:uncharacterized protein YuzE